MLSLLLLLACGTEPSAPVDPSEDRPHSHSTPVSKGLRAQLGMARLQRSELDPVLGAPLDYEHHRVFPLSLQVFEGFRISGALYVPKSNGPYPGIVMAHGHFGEGKSSGEAQAPSHALAHQGYMVLAMDTPGVEEGDTPERQIHHESGRKNRAALEEAGTTAMAVQLHGLQAALDYLEKRGDVRWFAAIGASGGAVQSFYLSHIDARIQAVGMASFVPMPRLQQADGCSCDWIGGPWPDDLIAALKIPSLWMSEGAETRPPTLGSNGHFVLHEGPHGFERPMIDSLADWLARTVPNFQPHRSLPDQLPHSPSTALASSSVGAAGIVDILQ